ncbi:bifunctional riboflavin kinase/FAD synthetase [Bacillota bacterium Lsc_1132]
MEVRKLEYPLQIIKTELPPLVLALGYFDGVHLGHQKVIQEAKKMAARRGWKSAVMTFDPHPSVVLRKAEQHVQYITPLRDKIEIIEKLEVDYLFIVHFTEEFANLLPQEFVDQYIIGLNAKHVVAGFDYSYGRMGKGTMETLPFHSRNQFTYSVIPKLVSNGEKISSTWIRKYLKEGKTEQLPMLLGRYYTTTGTVVHGDQRGRTIGFPTANVELQDDYIVPPLGVYAVKLKVGGKWYKGVCNIGFKPTFNKMASPKPSIEVHLFDFQDDIYGKEVEIEWHIYLRKERKFSGIEELVAQIGKDKQAAFAYFN